MEEEKSMIINMVNDIYEQCVIDYLFVLVKDAYRDSCCATDSKQSPVAPDLIA